MCTGLRALVRYALIKHVPVVWIFGFTCDGILRVEDLTQLALKLFEIERKHLLEEKEEYSCAVVVVITPEGRYYEEVEFNDETEMDVAYAAIVERAKGKNATVIITINTAREQKVEGELGPTGGANSQRRINRDACPNYFWTDRETSKHEPALFCAERPGKLGDTNRV